MEMCLTEALHRKRERERSFNFLLFPGWKTHLLSAWLLLFVVRGLALFSLEEYVTEYAHLCVWVYEIACLQRWCMLSLCQAQLSFPLYIAPHAYSIIPFLSSSQLNVVFACSSKEVSLVEFMKEENVTINVMYGWYRLISNQTFLSKASPLW